MADTTPAYLRCVAPALMLVPTAQVEALITSARSITALLRGYVAVIQYNILTLDIEMLPLLAKTKAQEEALKQFFGVISTVNDAEALLAGATEQLNIVASSISGMCPALGQLNEIVKPVINLPLSSWKELRSKTNVLQSLRYKYEGDIA
jgi:hypothetical protein